MTNRRRSERYRVALPVLIKDAQGGELTRTVDVSAHGLAVGSARSRSLRQYVELEVELPAPAPRISVTAMVARTFDEGEAWRGLGLDFFLFDAKAKAEWYKFMALLKDEAVQASKERMPAARAPSLPPNAAEPDEEAGTPTFIIKPRDLGRLWSFFRGEMSRGLVRLESPVLKAEGEPVDILVVHPNSQAEWTLPGKVARALAQGRGGRPMLEVAITPPDADTRAAFRNFVATGRGMIEEDVFLSSELPKREPEADRAASVVINLDEIVEDLVDDVQVKPVDEEDTFEGESTEREAAVAPGPPPPAEVSEPAPPAPSTTSLSGRLFASFFFEAAESERPKALAPVQPASGAKAPTTGSIALAGSLLSAQVTPRTRAGSNAEEAPTPVSEPPIVRGAPAPPPQSARALAPPLPAPVPPDETEPLPGLEVHPLRAQAVPVVRGAPLLDGPGQRPPAPRGATRPPPPPPPPDLPRTPPPPPRPTGRAEPEEPRTAARRPASRGLETDEPMSGAHRAVSTEGSNPHLDRDIALARARVVRSPNSVTACYRLGSLLMKRGDNDEFAEALDTLKRVITLEPNHPGAHHAAAEVLARRGDYALASEHLSRARRLGYNVDPELERLLAHARRVSGEEQPA